MNFAPSKVIFVYAEVQNSLIRDVINLNCLQPMIHIENKRIQTAFNIEISEGFCLSDLYRSLEMLVEFLSF